MKKHLPLILLLAMAAPANAELSEEAKANEKAASLYAQMDMHTQAAYSVGIVIGMRTVFDLMGKEKPIAPPESEDVYALLNYCYVAGHCRHVSPGAIALSAYEKPSVAHKALLHMESDAVKNDK